MTQTPYGTEYRLLTQTSSPYHDAFRTSCVFAVNRKNLNEKASLNEGHGLKPCRGPLRSAECRSFPNHSADVLYQGTTLVVPLTTQGRGL